MASVKWNSVTLSSYYHLCFLRGRVYFSSALLRVLGIRSCSFVRLLVFGSFFGFEFLDEKLDNCLPLRSYGKNSFCLMAKSVLRAYLPFALISSTTTIKVPVLVDTSSGKCVVYFDRSSFDQ